MRHRLRTRLHKLRDGGPDVGINRALDVCGPADSRQHRPAASRRTPGPRASTAEDMRACVAIEQPCQATGTQLCAGVHALLLPLGLILQDGQDAGAALAGSCRWEW